MSADLHAQATDLFAQGELLERLGEPSAAAGLFLEAARLEEQALGTVPEDRVRTRSVLAESTVSLYRRAGLIEQAGEAARRLIGMRLAESVIDYLIDTISEARWSSVATAEGLDVGRTYRVALDGPAVRPGGLIGVDQAVLKMDQFTKFIWRVGEWDIGAPLRDRGGPLPELVDAIRPLVSPAAPGSYSFDLRVEARPVQMPLFGRALDATHISEAFFRLLEAAANEGTDGVVAQVTDPQYQTVFLQQIRNIAPTGRQLSVVSIAPQADKRVARLLPENRKGMERAIRERRPKMQRVAQVQRGVLRGLHLDEKFLVLRDDQGERRLRIADGATLDDLIGPLVNHKVEVDGELVRGRFHATDVRESDDWDDA